MLECDCIINGHTAGASEKKLGQDIVVIDISGIKVADRVDETEMAKEKRFLENSCGSRCKI